MLKTRTGGFPIGFRRGWSTWQRDVDGWISWAKSNDFALLDVGSDGDQVGAAITAAGLGIGSADLRAWGGLITSDLDKRKAAVEDNAAYIETMAGFGVKNFFVVLLPDDTKKSRGENFKLAVEGYQALAPALEKFGARVVIEGWPGEGALSCTPEGYRAIIKEVASPSIGINYDPSHLIRMGIDPIRFLEEFSKSVYHVHGKDTELLSEGLYEYGTEQPATFGKARGFGAMHWRYTIPGHGVMRWTRAFEILAASGYEGGVCIELEDEHFNTDEAGEKQGLLAGGHFLASA